MVLERLNSQNTDSETMRLLSPGQITTIVGPPNSAKTFDLITALEGFSKKGDGVPTQMFTPSRPAQQERSDCVVRDPDCVVRDNLGYKQHSAKEIFNAKEIFEHLNPNTSVVGIDRAHLLGPEIVQVVQCLRARHHQVFVTGNGMNSKLEPYRLNGSAYSTFGDVIAISDFVRNQKARCAFTARTDAGYSFSLDNQLGACTMAHHPTRTQIIEQWPCKVPILMREGSISVITGPMGSNKTTTMLGRYSQVQDSAVLFQPGQDNRYSDSAIQDHTKSLSFDAISVSSAEEILEQIDAEKFHVFIDEFFMLDDSLPKVIQILRARGCSVTLTGLDMNFELEPLSFQNSQHTVGEIFAMADQVTKLTSKHIFMDGSGILRHEDARFTMRKQLPGMINKQEKVLGGFELYQAVSIEGHPYREIYANMFSEAEKA